jgi:signal-transduction protein with cAMP-binding, CBS, and nucleotidyltransferase domain
LNKFPAYDYFSNEEKSHVIESLFIKKFKKGEILLENSEDSRECLLIIMDGKVDVINEDDES